MRLSLSCSAVRSLPDRAGLGGSTDTKTEPEQSAGRPSWTLIDKHPRAAARDIHRRVYSRSSCFNPRRMQRRAQGRAPLAPLFMGR